MKSIIINIFNCDKKIANALYFIKLGDDECVFITKTKNIYFEKFYNTHMLRHKNFPAASFFFLFIHL